jgi:PAS domain S-box-containing protein
MSVAPSPPLPPPGPDGSDRVPGVLFTSRLEPDGKFRFESPAAAAAEELLEVSADELSRMLTDGRLPCVPAAGPGFWESARRSAADLTPWWREVRLVGPRTGREAWVRVHAVPRREPGGTVVWTGLLVDVTDLKAAEDAAARSEAWLRAALSSAQMLGWDWDLAAGRLYYSTDYAGFFGLPRDRDYALAEHGWACVHPDDLPAIEEARRRAVEVGDELRYEYRGRAPAADGTPRWFATRGQVLRGPDGRPARVTAVTTDVTDRKRAELERGALDRRLLDAQKWESLGVLAGGVAHAFNNILTVVLGCAGLARKAVPAESPAAANLGQVEQACRRATDLCRQLLAYAGRGPVAVGRTDLNQVIRESAALLGVPAADRARVVFDLAADLPPIQPDTAQVRQVLVNLVMNAVEAAGPAAGEVRVRTDTVEATGWDAADPGYRLPPELGQYVRLEVSDTGPGIAPEVKARMFDPFYTTKFAGRGLGLAAVLGIVRSHNGAIRVDTEPGRGTTVRVLWPAAPLAPGPAPPPAAAARQPEPAPRADRPARAALIVDDEMYVREVAASTLEENGFEPLLAGDGAAGVELFRRHRNAVRVAVVDVVLPGLGGEQVLAALREIEPALPVVLVSGFTEARLTGSVAGPGVEFLRKPFHPEELIAAVERVLGAAAGG